MHADDVGLGKQLLQGDIPGQRAAGFVLVTVKGQHVHAQGPGDARHGLSDAAEAHDAHGFACQLHQGIVPETPVRIGVPFAVVHSRTVGFHVLADRQQVGEHHLRHGSGAIGGDVGHGNVAFFGRSHIHHVVAGSQYAHVTKLRTCVHGFRRDGALVDDDGFGITDAGHDFIGLGAVVYRQGAKAFKALPAQIPGVFGISVQDYDFHVCSSVIAQARARARFVLARIRSAS